VPNPDTTDETAPLRFPYLGHLVSTSSASRPPRFAKPCCRIAPARSAPHHGAAWWPSVPIPLAREARQEAEPIKQEKQTRQFGPTPEDAPFRLPSFITKEARRCPCFCI
jgi:hypothetical protein